MKNNRGFTLIELMVVVIVIAILAAIAIPSYLSQTRRARRNAVEDAMQQIALAQERFRADCSTYATSFSFACASGAPPTFPALSTFYSSSYYAVTLPAVSSSASTAYTIAAVANSTGSQNNDTASGTSCSSLFYTFGVDAAVDTACSVTTAAGQLTKCPAVCWSQ